MADARRHIADSVAAVRKHRLDSATAARNHFADSIKVARKERMDSIATARKERTDSIAAVRKHRTDSLAAIRKYRSSRKYKDSVKQARQARIDSIKEVRTARLDSIKDARQAVMDSVAEARKARTDSIRAAQKARTDSLAEARKHLSDSLAIVRKYRSSKRYKDSVADARQDRIDSIKEVRTARLDSVKDARQAVIDSIAQAREARTDSIRAVQKARTDSLAAIRKHRSDSLAVIRKYRSSKVYKDSLADARQDRIDSIREVRTARLDSVRDARKAITDSIAALREAHTDSIRAVQKARSDSLAVIRKYRSSKRYSDSVTLVRRHRADSIKVVREAFRDSVADVRKHTLDSIKTVRQHTLDSMKLVRTKRLDSLKLVRKAKSDSLAKKKEIREKLAKAKAKRRQDQLKLNLELKLKQKREAWSNESMLKKNWGPVRRTAQNSFTHYNYYFNARRKMEEAEMNMRRVNRENYDSLIGLFPFDPNKDSSLLSADMDSIIRKASVGIQIHDPRIKWSDDMYLLLGQAYYYKGGYENAAIAFRYILSTAKKGKKGSKNNNYRSGPSPSIVDKKKKSKLNIFQHKSVHNDAILWLARTYTTWEKTEDAGAILSLLEFEPDLPDNLHGKLALEKAFAYLKAESWDAASEQLTIAETDSYIPNWLRQRIAFLNGQLLMQSGNNIAAAESFEKTLSHFPKLEMEFYARKYIAYNKLLAGNEPAVAMAPLKRMLRDNKFSKYYDQVYYVLGSLAVKAKKDNEAITYFTKSTRAPKADKKQKAISFAALGDVYYAGGHYANAKAAYDSASKYASPASKKNEAVASAIKRSSGLTEVSVPLAVIHNADSLLALAKKSKREQQAVARRLIRSLQKQRDDSIFRAESGATAVTATTTGSAADGSGEASSWYFSNPTLITQGSADFKRKWGSRPLVDNWRRTSAIALTSSKSSEDGSSSDEDATASSAEKGLDENGLPTEEALLAAIPNTQEQKDEVITKQQQAYMDLATAYANRLQDYDQAIETLDTLDLRYPKHPFKEQELYLRYQMALKQNKLDDAKKYADELMTKYPKSKYAAELRPKQSEARPEADASEVAKYFDDTYNMLMDHQYTEAQMRANLGKTRYKHPVYQKRFEVVEAMALAGTGNFDMADSAITTFIRSNPSDSLTAWAKSVKKYIGEVRNGGKPSWYKEGWVPHHVKSPEKKAEEAEKAAEALAKAEEAPEPPFFPDAPAAYTYEADSPHLCLAVLPGLDSRSLGFKNTVRSFDSAKYTYSNLQLLIDYYGMDKAVMVVRPFADAKTATEYMNNLMGSGALKGFLPGEVSFYIISTKNYKKLFTEKAIDEYAGFYGIYYKK